jgi:hypothetical protein
MFITNEVVSLSDTTAKEQPIVGADKEAIDKLANMEKPVTPVIKDKEDIDRLADMEKPPSPVAKDKPTSGQKPDDVTDNAEVTLPTEVTNLTGFRSIFDASPFLYLLSRHTRPLKYLDEWIECWHNNDDKQPVEHHDRNAPKA